MDLQKTLADHLLWLESNGNEGVQANFSWANLANANLEKANLSGADFFQANLTRANLENANLTGANLRSANLVRSDLTEANLEKAYLERAYLMEANLLGASFTGADLLGAILSGADFTSVDLTGANLKGTRLTGVNLTNTKLPNYQIPQNVSLIGYKKVRDNIILKLKIPFEAKRTGTPKGNKCRAEFAKVIGWRKENGKEFHTEPGEFYPDFDTEFIYRMGEIARPDSYNPDIREECTHGIHFFLNESDAQNYNFF